MNTKYIVLDPTESDGTKIFAAYPGCGLKVGFSGKWTPDKDASNVDYWPPEGDGSSQMNGHNAYMVMLRLIFKHPRSGKVVTKTGWFPYAGGDVEFGPYQNYRVILRARMNEVPASYPDNANEPGNAMTAKVEVTHF